MTLILFCACFKTLSTSQWVPNSDDTFIFLQNFHKIHNFHIFVPVFGISLENATKWVQTFSHCFSAHNEATISLFTRGTEIQSVTCSIRDWHFSPPCSMSERGEGFRLMSDAVVGSSDCRKTLKLLKNSNKRCTSCCFYLKIMIFFFKISTFQIWS